MGKTAHKELVELSRGLQPHPAKTAAMSVKERDAERAKKAKHLEKMAQQEKKRKEQEALEKEKAAKKPRPKSPLRQTPEVMEDLPVSSGANIITIPLSVLRQSALPASQITKPVAAAATPATPTTVSPAVAAPST